MLCQHDNTSNSHLYYGWNNIVKVEYIPTIRSLQCNKNNAGFQKNVKFTILW
jgi:hypothetical protein